MVDQVKTHSETQGSTVQTAGPESLTDISDKLKSAPHITLSGAQHEEGREPASMKVKVSSSLSPAEQALKEAQEKRHQEKAAAEQKIRDARNENHQNNQDRQNDADFGLQALFSEPTPEAPAVEASQPAQPQPSVQAQPVKPQPAVKQQVQVQPQPTVQQKPVAQPKLAVPQQQSEQQKPPVTINELIELLLKLLNDLLAAQELITDNAQNQQTIQLALEQLIQLIQEQLAERQERATEKRSASAEAQTASTPKAQKVRPELVPAAAKEPAPTPSDEGHKLGRTYLAIENERKPTSSPVRTAESDKVERETPTVTPEKAMTLDEARSVLGVTTEAPTEQEINKAYHEKARDTHTSRSGGDAEKFIDVQKARDTLLSPETAKMEEGNRAGVVGVPESPERAIAKREQEERELKQAAEREKTAKAKDVEAADKADKSLEEKKQPEQPKPTDAEDARSKRAAWIKEKAAAGNTATPIAAPATTPTPKAEVKVAQANGLEEKKQQEQPKPTDAEDARSKRAAWIKEKAAAGNTATPIAAPATTPTPKAEVKVAQADGMSNRGKVGPTPSVPTPSTLSMN